jgi:acetyl esterase/lipase
VSPALADLDGLPPLLIIAGGAECLVSCAERIAANAAAAVDLVVGIGQAVEVDLAQQRHRLPVLAPVGGLDQPQQAGQPLPHACGVEVTRAEEVVRARRR